MAEQKSNYSGSNISRSYSKGSSWKVKRISTGSYDFNKWLYGGYEKDVISMIAGPPGSGKTNFCVLVACSQARKGNRVLFIDTEGGFSTDRIKQVVGKEKLENVLKNILIFQPTNFDEQVRIFDNIEGKIKNEDIQLIIVDGMAMLYRLEMGGASMNKDSSKVQDINRQVSKQMKVLAEISRKEKIPVVLTNQVYNNFVSKEDFMKGNKGDVNIVGGDLLKYWSKCILRLENNQGKRTAVLEKHRSLPNKRMDFIIKDSGIYKKGWI